MASVWGELKRRNVVRVAVAYVIIAWLILQVGDTLAPALHLAEWVNTALAFFLILGFPMALFFAWAFELTPEGLKKEKDVDRSRSITPVTGRKLDFAVIGLMAIALAYFAFDEFTTDAPQSIDEPVVVSTQPSIAVLPFVNMSSDPEQEYFSDGISEEILNLLAKIPNLKVIGRTSSFAFKGKNEDLRVIGEKLGVKTVLEGSVRTFGDRVRITAQLIDVSDGAHLWSESYDRTLTDIFAVQDDVAAAIIDALQMHVGTMPTRGRPTDDTESYALFLKAMALLNAVEPIAAQEPLLRAIELDPEFAEAYELLARAHWQSNEQQPTIEAAGKALAIDPALVMAQAMYQQAKIGSHLAGIEAFEQALREQPSNHFLLIALSWNLRQAGYFRESLSLSQRSVDLDPLSELANSGLSRVLDAVGHESEAVAARELWAQLSGKDMSWQKGQRRLLDKQDEQAIAHFEADLQENSNRDTSWVRDLITHARDPVTGQAYLDRRIPEIIAASPEGLGVERWTLHGWYLYFGFLDRYFELLLENDPNDARWTDADFYLLQGITYWRTGFTAHPKFLEVAETMGLIKIWEKRGPPDFCDKVDGEWVCK